jgi:PAS domain S-box-containing protein
LNEAVLRQLIDALADGIVLAGEDGRIVLANRRAAEMFGYRPAELAGQLVESLMPAGLREAHRVDRASYALKPVARPMADRARLVGLRRDGSTWTQPQTSPLSWPGSGSAMRSSGWTTPSTRSAIMSSGPGAPVAATGRPGDMLS